MACWSGVRSAGHGLAEVGGAADVLLEADEVGVAGGVLDATEDELATEAVVGDVAVLGAVAELLEQAASAQASTTAASAPGKRRFMDQLHPLTSSGDAHPRCLR